MGIYYETPGSIDEALEMLASKMAIFIDTEDALVILTKYPGQSYRLHWNSPVQGRVVIIPEPVTGIVSRADLIITLDQV